MTLLLFSELRARVNEWARNCRDYEAQHRASTNEFAHAAAEFHRGGAEAFERVAELLNAGTGFTEDAHAARAIERSQRQSMLTAIERSQRQSMLTGLRLGLAIGATLVAIAWWLVD